MLYAADFRARARASLSGNWTYAVIAGLIIALVGGGSGGPQFNFELNSGNPEASVEWLGQTIFSTVERYPGLFAGSVLAIFLSILTAAIVYGVIGSTVAVGYARFHLNMADGLGADLSHMVGYFSHMKTAFCAHFLRGLYTLLWSLLFIIPGIIARYSYAMTDYILAEHPDMTASEALAASKEMMVGNRWRLFCLDFSFIGWSFLCLFTFGLGVLWLDPYRTAAQTHFYRARTRGL